MLKASRDTPAPTAPSSVHMPAKRARSEDAAARETAGEFTAAAARARQPDHQAYDQAEHEAGLAGQGAQVRLPDLVFPRPLSILIIQMTCSSCIRALSGKGEVATELAQPL